MLELGVPVIGVTTLHSAHLHSEKSFFSFIIVHMKRYTKTFQDQILQGQRPCPVRDQLRTAKDETPDGLIHRVLGQSNRIWCPYIQTVRSWKLIGQTGGRQMRAKSFSFFPGFT